MIRRARTFHTRVNCSAPVAATLVRSPRASVVVPVWADPSPLTEKFTAPAASVPVSVRVYESFAVSVVVPVPVRADPDPDDATHAVPVSVTVRLPPADLRWVVKKS